MNATSTPPYQRLDVPRFRWPQVFKVRTRNV